MNDSANAAPRSNKRKIILILASVVVVGVCAGAFYWTYTCPCDRLPGAILLGEVETERVTDWNFANNVDLCQLQITADWRPHAINLNCMSTPAGNLYLSCSVCDTKFWASKVADNPRGRLRLNDVVYPVTITRVTDPAEMDQAWNARVAKLQRVGGGPYNPVPPPDAERNDRWWTFRLESAI